jgi:hypothetical protein
MFWPRGGVTRRHLLVQDAPVVQPANYVVPPRSIVLPARDIEGRTEWRAASGPGIRDKEKLVVGLPVAGLALNARSTGEVGGCRAVSGWYAFRAPCPVFGRILA